MTPERIYFRFIRLHQRVFSEMGQTLKPTGLSIPQFDVLSTLTEQQGLSQSDLAARLYVTKGNVSASSTGLSRPALSNGGARLATGAPTPSSSRPRAARRRRRASACSGPS